MHRDRLRLGTGRLAALASVLLALLLAAAGLARIAIPSRPGSAAADGPAAPSPALRPITEEELQVLLDQGTQAGIFEESEQDMVQGVFSLGDQRVYSLMTPRTEVIWLEVNDSMEIMRQKIEENDFSRFPVCQGSLDMILGIVEARDLLVPMLAGEPIRLKEKLRPEKRCQALAPRSCAASSRMGSCFSR